MKSKKTSDDLGDLHLDDWKEKRENGTNTLHLISYDFPKPNRRPTRCKKQS